jgi:hypothetical protein
MPLGIGRPTYFRTVAGPSANEPSTAATGRRSRRPALPTDLPKAIQFLEDRELDWLLRVAIQEAKRRGRPMPTTVAPPTSTPGASSLPIPEQARPSGGPIYKQKIGVAAVALTRGQVNAVRAAFKGWCHALTNCPAIRLIEIGGSQGFGRR